VLPGDAELDPSQVAAAGHDAVVRALAEDLDAAGDVTARAIVPVGTRGTAELVARAPGVAAGLGLVAVVFAALDAEVRVSLVASDGDRVSPGDVLGSVRGPLRAILTGERTALNLVTHLSGVATATRAFVDAIAGTGCVVRDTRKTTPGLRLLEKAAVVAGGGVNHRLGLSDALLVKDNHVAVAGSVRAAVTAALDRADGRHVQVEVDDLDELADAVDAGARDLLLDNFDVEVARLAVARCRGWSETLGERIVLEASGTIRHDTVRAYADSGVDRVAVGAITHSAPQLDVALDVVLDRGCGVASDPAAGFRRADGRGSRTEG
jgi:nicotinate-nucleotide pyrophosphorylase (carboxylating)